MEHIVSAIWSKIERSLFGAVEAGLDVPLSEGLKRLVSVLEVLRAEEHVRPASWQMRGRPRLCRADIARAFVAKAVLDIPTTKQLRERLLNDPSLRRICGFQTRQATPSEATFSRAFAEFAQMELAERVHQALVEQHVGERVVMHLCRDATEIAAREKAAKKARKPKEAPKKPGRKGKNDPPRELKRLEKQRTQTPEEAFAELPRVCDIGVKTDEDGHRHYWRGYKEHIDWADNGFPLQAYLTSASVHDSQAAIPLAKRVAQKRTVLYQLMDSAYDADEIIAAIEGLGHRPIIAIHPRRTTAVPFDPATAVRYRVRTVAERGNSRLKDEFGGRHVRVRGALKVHQHVMFGLLALGADVLLKMAVGAT